MRKILIIAILLWMIPDGVLQAQRLTVVDQQTLQPLEFVSLYSPAPRITAVTDRQGQVDLGPFEEADSIYFRLIGYETEVRSYAALQQSDFTLLMKEDRLTLEEVVVSANRWEQDRREVPFKISVLRAREVAFQQPQTAADFLGTSGDVFIQKSQLGGGSPMIRGFAANRVLLVIDGVRMNNAIFRSGNLQNVISLDPHAVQNAEVIFGPSSVIYGSDAIGGVMDFHTLLPKLSSGENTLFGSNALLRYSSVNFEKTGHVDVHFGQRKWAFVSSVSFSDYEDLTMGSHGPAEYRREAYVERLNGKDLVVANDNPDEQIPSGYRQFNMMQRLRYRPSDSWDLNYGFHFSTTSDVPRYDRLIEQDGGVFRSAEWFYGPQRWIMNNFQVQHRREEGLFDQMRIVLAHQLYRESRHDRRFGRATLRSRAETVNAASLNLDFDKQLSEKWAAFYGAEAIYNRIGSEAEVEDIVTGTTEPTSTRYPDGSTWASYAVYANLKANLSAKVTLLGGVRYNLVDVAATFDKTFFDFPFEEARLTNGALTGSAGITYRPEPGWQFNLNLSTGFRSTMWARCSTLSRDRWSYPTRICNPNMLTAPMWGSSGPLPTAFASMRRPSIPCWTTPWCAAIFNSTGRTASSTTGR
jgi:hemoglobin/transferrin/lactoferrin receptor protein